MDLNNPPRFLNPNFMGVNMFKKIAAAGAALVGSVGSAMAAVPADVSTALTDAKADALTVAGLALIVIIGIAAFKYMRRGV